MHCISSSLSCSAAMQSTPYRWRDRSTVTHRNAVAVKCERTFRFYRCPSTQKMSESQSTTSLVMSHESDACSVFVPRACLLFTLPMYPRVHAHSINWTQRTQTWKRHLLSCDVTTKVLARQRYLPWSVYLCWKSDTSSDTVFLDYLYPSRNQKRWVDLNWDWYNDEGQTAFLFSSSLHL